MVYEDSIISLEWYFLYLAIVLYIDLLWDQYGAAPVPPPVLDVKKESISPISLTNLFQLVADDLQTLNKNLQSVSSSENSYFGFLYYKLFLYFPLSNLPW